MGPLMIGDPNFPITIALVGWSGFSFDSFDSTYPDSLFISHIGVHALYGVLEQQCLVVTDGLTDCVPVSVAVFVHSLQQGAVLLQRKVSRSLVGKRHFLPRIVKRSHKLG